MAIDVGEVEARGGDYFGPVLNRAGRMLAAAHGGQVLLSAEAHAALSARGGWQAKALGEVRFKGIGGPCTSSSSPGRAARGVPAASDRPAAASVRPAHSAARSGVRAPRAGRDAATSASVYRAYQPSVGREVAIKVIRPELVNHPSFVRRFEPRRGWSPQLEHPHIVPLYDYWRDPEGAYLVMRWLRGGSLRQALERGPGTSAGRPAAVAGRRRARVRPPAGRRPPRRQAGERPARRGRQRVPLRLRHRRPLVDSEDPGRLVTASPAYVPPEERRRRAATPRSDLYGLGLLTFELLTGQRRRWTGRSRRWARPARAARRARRGRRAGDGGRPRRSLRVGGRVRRGIRGRLGQARRRGRELHARGEPVQGPAGVRETRRRRLLRPRRARHELVDAVGDRRLVAVVGPSGIGKSSVVRAGLVPALRGGALPERRLARHRPVPRRVSVRGARRRAPARRRRATGRSRRGARTGRARDPPRREADPPARQRAGARRRPVRGAVHAGDRRGERRRFLGGPHRARRRRRTAGRVLVTLRADFLDHPLRDPEFGELLRAGMVAVAAPSEDELAEAIERPA